MYILSLFFCRKYFVFNKKIMFQRFYGIKKKYNFILLNICHTIAIPATIRSSQKRTRNTSRHFQDIHIDVNKV